MMMQSVNKHKIQYKIKTLVINTMSKQSPRTSHLCDPVLSDMRNTLAVLAEQKLEPG